MITRLWIALIAAAVIVGGLSTQATVTVLPLFEPDDPVRLSGGAFDSEDPSHPAITVTLENTTSLALSTSRVWLSVSRFFTPAEVRRNGDRIVSSCGIMARANNDEAAQVIPPGTKVQVKLGLGQTCVLDPQHEHFFVFVERITAGQRFADATWKRDPADFGRLLQAAMPHAR